MGINSPVETRDHGGMLVAEPGGGGGCSRPPPVYCLTLCGERERVLRERERVLTYLLSTTCDENLPIGKARA